MILYLNLMICILHVSDFWVIHSSSVRCVQAVQWPKGCPSKVLTSRRNRITVGSIWSGAPNKIDPRPCFVTRSFTPMKLENPTKVRSDCWSLWKMLKPRDGKNAGLAHTRIFDRFQVVSIAWKKISVSCARVWTLPTKNGVLVPVLGWYADLEAVLLLFSISLRISYHLMSIPSISFLPDLSAFFVYASNSGVSSSNGQ